MIDQQYELNEQTLQELIQDAKKTKDENRRLMEEVQSAAKLAEFMTSVSSLLTNMPAMSFSKDAETGVYLACNQAFAEYAGKEHPEQVVGLTDYEIFDPDTAQHFVEDDQKALAMEEAYIFFEDVPDATGKDFRNLQTTKTKFQDDAGRLCLLGMCVDVTEMTRIKTAEAENKAKQEELETRIMLQEQLLEQNSMITAMASDYRSVYHVNLDQDDAVCYRADPDDPEQHEVGVHFPFYERFAYYAEAYIDDDYREGFLQFIDPDNIRQALSKEDIISYQYLVRRNGREYYEKFRMAGVRHAQDRDDHIVHAIGVGFTIIDSEMRETKAKYQDFAVLYRTNSQSRALEEQLRRRNIPYMIYSGNSFFERAEVKDMMAYFKLAANVNDDESFKRVVNKPARGIGDTSLNALSAAALSHGTSLFMAAGAPDLESFGLKGGAVAKIRAFCAMIEKAAATLGSTDAYAAGKTLASESGLYMFYKSDNSIEGQARAANVQELLDSIAGYVEEVQGDFLNGMVEDGRYADPSEVPDTALPVVTLPEFLENISLLSNVDVTEEEASNKVALMTVHSAKGLEFPYVFVTGMEENLFPSGGWSLTEQELEEERRLFYVALTRAKKAVTLSFAQTRLRNGKHESNAPSRFLREIAPQYIQNPLRKEDFTAAREEDDDHPGFRFGSGSGSIRTFGTAKPASRPAQSTARPMTREAVLSRPLPPKVPDAEFVPDPMSSFQVGESIEHNRFGAGRVLELSGKVPEIKAKIVFEKYGEKLLLLKFAKIRHI